MTLIKSMYQFNKKCYHLESNCVLCVCAEQQHVSLCCCEQSWSLFLCVCFFGTRVLELVCVSVCYRGNDSLYR